VIRVAPENLAAIRALAEIHSRRGETHEADSLAAAPEPDPAPPEAPEPAAVAPPPEPVPIRPVRLSIVTSPAPAEPTSTPEPAAPSPPARPHAPAALSIVPPPPRVAHPDESALPKLEAFLAAIVRAREALRIDRPADR
jgi:hypothetical protein